MQHSVLLHNILQESCAVKHKVRLKGLMAAVESVMIGANLSLTSLGRNMRKDIQPGSRINEIDYLLGNGHLLNERSAIYSTLNRWMIRKEKILYIVVDWSSIVAHKEHLLRASLLRKGRCVTVYEEIFPEKKLGTGEAHQRFLTNLKSVLPEGVEVCIIVDAGFKTDFFVQVQAASWDYIARVLSNMHYKQDDKWEPCTNLYEKATAEAQAVGPVILAKSNKVDSHLYLYKNLKEVSDKDVTIQKRKIKYGKKEKEYRNAAKKPWLIASSMKISANKIMAIYKKRMKIEHDFRDTKDPKWGLGVRESRSKDPTRIILQLLIGFLAAFLLWLIGLCLEKKKLHFHFQANSIKHKRVLSLIFLALEAIKSGYLRKISEADLLAIREDGLHD